MIPFKVKEEGSNEIFLVINITGETVLYVKETEDKRKELNTMSASWLMSKCTFVEFADYKKC